MYSIKDVLPQITKTCQTASNVNIKSIHNNLYKLHKLSTKIRFRAL